MIHDLLLSLDRTLPFYPPIVAALGGLLVVVLALSVFGRSRGAALVSIAATFLALGLAAGLLGINRPHGSLRWGPVEDLAEALIGPPAFRRWEQVAAAGLAVAVGLLYIAYNAAFSPRPGEQARQQLERDPEQSQALGDH